MKLNADIQLPYAYKLADFKPAFGSIFDDFLSSYRFWGHCDLDIVWGDIRHFITDDILSQYQIISARKNKMCGHFSLYRNEAEVSRAFMKSPGYLDTLQSWQCFGFDEIIMTDTVKQISEKEKIKVYWPKFLFNFVNPRNDSPSVLGKLKNRWLWENGKLFEIDDQERRLGQVAYLHFMTWKRSMKACYVAYTDDPKQFYISYSHIGLTKLDPIPFGSSVRWEIDKTFNIASRIWRRITSLI